MQACIASSHPMLPMCPVLPFLPPSKPYNPFLLQVGLKAAVGAGMRCIITPTNSTDSVDFMAEGATAVVPVLKGEGYRVRWERGGALGPAAPPRVHNGLPSAAVRCYRHIVAVVSRWMCPE